MRKSVYVPDADRSEMIELPVSCFLLRHAQGNVLFDTGCHPSVAGESGALAGHGEVHDADHAAGRERARPAFPAIGFSADDVDVVVCSHLHPDHCGCNAFFKRASVIVHAKEIEAARKPNAVPMGYLASEWDFGTFDALTGERDVFGDGQDRADRAARPHAGQHRRAGRAREERHVPARRRHREPARQLDTRRASAQRAGPRRAG